LQDAVELPEDMSIVVRLVPPKPPDAEAVKATSTPAVVDVTYTISEFPQGLVQHWYEASTRCEVQQIDVRTSEFQTMLPYLRNIGNRKRYVEAEATVTYTK
jgi:hypothetical protein